MPAESKQLVLVTGLSGGGKSTALRALEDIGFYCVDNLPAALLREFVRLISRRKDEEYERVALGVDARSPGQDLGEIPVLPASNRCPRPSTPRKSSSNRCATGRTG